MGEGGVLRKLSILPFEGGQVLNPKANVCSKNTGKSLDGCRASM